MDDISSGRHTVRWKRFFRFGLRHLAVFIVLCAVVAHLFQPPGAAGLVQTGRELDLAIFGEGYFMVNDPSSGETMYTRHGALAMDSFSRIVFSSLGSD